MENADKITETILDIIMLYGPKVLLALVTLIIGLWVISLINRTFRKALEVKSVDPSLRGFFISLSGVMLKVLLVISVAGMIGIEMTSFIAVLGAAGLAVGMALSGTLQNFAGGVMILIFRPFKVGDFVEMQGFSGTVDSIQIFHTVLKTPDNKTIIIPNAPISSGSLVNYSSETKRRLDFTFGIGYGDSIDKAKEILTSILESDLRIDKDPAPFIAVSELADSFVNLVVRVWLDASNYWAVHFDTLEKVKKEFDEEGISIPFPQRDVHIHNAA